MLLLLISFVAGVLTVLAPCVLPVLPIMVSGSLGGGKNDRFRPYVIALSLALSIVGFTLLLKVSTLLVNLSPSVITYFSGGLLIALGLVAMAPELWEYLMIKLRLEVASQRFLSQSEHSKSAYLGPVLIGIALGPVFASCSPTYAYLLATVLPFSLAAGIFYLVAYSVGLVATILLVALVGRRYIKRFRWAVDTHSVFRRSLGVLFVLIGLAFVTGFYVTAETWVANHLPFDEANFERTLLQTQSKHPTTSVTGQGAGVLNVSSYPAPEFAGLTNWINSKPLTIASLKGHVVLVDFWTYSCINCLRTLPYIEKWNQAYAQNGLVIIGVNTPEFAFEHNPQNVAQAVTRLGIAYPVALDNNYDTWNAYNNNSWPADYLIDKDGNVRYISIGEGDYDNTERAIQYLLGVNKPLQVSSFNVPITNNQTPETYFGTNREDSYTGSPSLNNGKGTYTPAKSVGTNQWTLSGNWTISPESITSNSADSTLTMKVESKDVYMVATTSSSASVGVSLPATEAGQYGSDVSNGTVQVSASRLYHIVSLNNFGETTVTLTVPAGVSLYTFTFGS